MVVVALGLGPSLDLDPGLDPDKDLGPDPDRVFLVLFNNRNKCLVSLFDQASFSYDR